MKIFYTVLNNKVQLNHVKTQISTQNAAKWTNHTVTIVFSFCVCMCIYTHLYILTIIVIYVRTMASSNSFKSCTTQSKIKT